MANEFIVRSGLKVTGSAEISSSLKVANLAAGAGNVLSIEAGGLLGNSGYSLNQNLNTSSNVTFNDITINGNTVIEGNLTVNGTASYINTQDLVIKDKLIVIASGSTTGAEANGGGIYISGANAAFTWDNGNTRMDINQALNVQGAVTATNFTGSLQGTASYANNAGLLDGQASSYYTNAANLTGTISNGVLPADISVTTVTASAGFLGNLTGTASFAATASFALNVPETASYALTSSWSINSFTASYVENAQTASYVTLAQTASYVETAQTASYVTLSQTASYVETAQTASYVLQAVSASYATTASYTFNAESASFASTASYVNPLFQDLVLTGSVQQTTLAKQQSTSVTTSTTTVAELSVTGLDAVFFDYVVKNSTTDLRTGTVMAVTNGSTVEYTETSTNDIGNTSGVILSVDLNGGNIRLRATATSGTWTVRAFARTI